MNYFESSEFLSTFALNHWHMASVEVAGGTFEGKNNNSISYYSEYIGISQIQYYVQLKNKSLMSAR